MAERNAVIPRECRDCGKMFKCTARDIRERQEHCNPGVSGRFVYPDCGFEEKVQSYLEVNP
jgi:hypothetical protein